MHKHPSRGIVASVDYPHEWAASDLRQQGCPRCVFMVSHTPVSRFSCTAIFKRVNKALYYSAEEGACPSPQALVQHATLFCGKRDKWEEAGLLVSGQIFIHKSCCSVDTNTLTQTFPACHKRGHLASPAKELLFIWHRYFYQGTKTAVLSLTLHWSYGT